MKKFAKTAAVATALIALLTFASCFGGWGGYTPTPLYEPVYNEYAWVAAFDFYDYYSITVTSSGAGGYDYYDTYIDGYKEQVRSKYAGVEDIRYYYDDIEKGAIYEYYYDYDGWYYTGAYTVEGLPTPGELVDSICYVGDYTGGVYEYLSDMYMAFAYDEATGLYFWEIRDAYNYSYVSISVGIKGGKLAYCSLSYSDAYGVATCIYNVYGLNSTAVVLPYAEYVY